jgi:putative SOS response-associated peptidase YedK
MCNEYRQRFTRQQITDQFSQLKIPMRWADAEANRPREEPIKPTDRATILRPVDPARPAAGLEGLDIRWWLVPAFHKGAVKDWRSMCTNARFETVDTAPTFRGAYKARRCLVPVSSFIEYSEPEGWRKGKPKMRHEISWGDELRYFAGLWERATPADLPEGVESFTFVTGPACPDVQPIHDRTPAVLTIDQGLTWLDLEGPGKAAFAEPACAGTYTVAHAPRDAVLSAELRRLI